ncbi:hypothetical protein FZI85_03345 [Mycobacterium sp. CBMA293]|uniref:hypothetical protein n=1 Tax=unclassified Mycolicibacterium TaxID=2636767 RepID=UPI0012DFBE09|nr:MULTISPECIES: hypothetical protein [unclassified Mycolicibacterium]MUL46970.1 hypothetical protein [Mycolicibacterium sp. CBMA 360]MUL58346.1 hypothetical protein [Mycolicibacterium sp. CBMA 335]MUL73804.1 hypothetical protein [Mycolicibacterium sp. CBMA 311]MUL93229.1 hypothetical protein [Mycolicibacterium sp. CBMA 230]MUM10072.1 hypothetical protein [Mycolicibacterium sp. CBMA 293]
MFAAVAPAEFAKYSRIRTLVCRGQKNHAQGPTRDPINAYSRTRYNYRLRDNLPAFRRAKRSTPTHQPITANSGNPLHIPWTNAYTGRRVQRSAEGCAQTSWDEMTAQSDPTADRITTLANHAAAMTLRLVENVNTRITATLIEPDNDKFRIHYAG